MSIQQHRTDQTIFDQAAASQLRTSASAGLLPQMHVRVLGTSRRPLSTAALLQMTISVKASISPAHSIRQDNAGLH